MDNLFRKFFVQSIILRNVFSIPDDIKFICKNILKVLKKTLFLKKDWFFDGERVEI